MTYMIEPRMPNSSPGMKFVGFRHIAIDKIIPTSKGPYINPRVRGLNTEKIQAHENAIRKGEYKPEYYVPPVVEEAEYGYFQNTGEHRYQAHLNVGEPTFYAAVVEWVDENGKSADYHRDVYMSNENSEFSGEVPQEKRKPEDVVATVVSMVDKDTIPSTDEAISSVLIDLGYRKKSNAHKDYMNKINAAVQRGVQVRKVKLPCSVQSHPSYRQ